MANERRGYIYVLANSAMPGLVKVGRTSRDPSQRAQELSGVTGIPTPFIVVYQQLFEDCQEAEDLVHSLLARKGYRESENREFFRAPVSEVVHAVAQLPHQVDVSAIARSARTYDQHEGADSDGADSDAAPWADLYQQAQDYDLGWGESLQDYEEALKLYIEAARLGCLAAYERIGDMYESGKGARQDSSEALRWFKEGTRKGNYRCYIPMALIYLVRGDNGNHQKCLAFAIRDRTDNFNTELETPSFSHLCADHLMWCFARMATPLPEAGNELLSIKDDLVKDLRDIADYQAEFGRPPFAGASRQALEWAEQHI